MQDFLKVTGMVIKVAPQNEYDRRITLLTKEAGKISAFVRGAKRNLSRFSASTDLFVFGDFDLYVGRDAYNVQNVEISNYFEFLRSDMEASLYAMYFSELVDFYARENNDEAVILLLLYRSFQGLKAESIKNTVVRRVFELKLFILEGELIPIDSIGRFDKSVYDYMDFLYECSIEKLFGLKVDDMLLESLEVISEYERKHLIDKPLKSLDILERMVDLGIEK